MTPERANAYQRVMHTLQELGPSKLQPAEQQRIRDAVDALLFSPGADEDPSARQALADAGELIRLLVDSGRWERQTAMQLLDDIAGCGPAAGRVLAAV
jgi:hypothetical protein